MKIQDLEDRLIRYRFFLRVLLKSLKHQCLRGFPYGRISKTAPKPIPKNKVKNKPQVGVSLVVVDGCKNQI
jgi:hypothetical protein